MRIAIVHHAEHVPFEDGYRPVRYGRLAQSLTAMGVDVVRICPSFAFAYQHQRPQEWSGRTSSEGTTVLVKTRSFAKSRSLDRFQFLRELCAGTGRYFESAQPFDLIIAGYPPPGMVRTIRKAVGPHVPIIADIRDLWPDALIPNNALGRSLEPAVKIFGKLLAEELKLANSVVALSPTMLNRAPSARRSQAIPIGMAHSSEDLSPHWPAGSDEAAFVFIGSFAPLFDFKSLFKGWQLFQETYPDASNCVLQIFGAGQRQAEVQSLAAGIHGLKLEGWLESKDVLKSLARVDVGISPTRMGQGTTLGNKVMEYLDAGLYVLSSLEPDTGAILADRRLGYRVESNPQSWADGFAHVMTNLPHIRQNRADRQARARLEFGHSASIERWREVIEDTIGKPLKCPVKDANLLGV